MMLAPSWSGIHVLSQLCLQLILALLHLTPMHFHQPSQHTHTGLQFSGLEADPAQQKVTKCALLKLLAPICVAGYEQWENSMLQPSVEDNLNFPKQSSYQKKKKKVGQALKTTSISQSNHLTRRRKKWGKRWRQPQFPKAIILPEEEESRASVKDNHNFPKQSSYQKKKKVGRSMFMRLTLQFRGNEHDLLFLTYFLTNIIIDAGHLPRTGDTKFQFARVIPKMPFCDGYNALSRI